MAIYPAKFIPIGQSAPANWIQIGSIAIDVNGIAGPNDFPYTTGISDEYDVNSYVIISDTTTAGLVGRSTGNNTGIAVAYTPTYWVTASKTDQGLIDLFYRLPVYSDFMKAQDLATSYQEAVGATGASESAAIKVTFNTATISSTYSYTNDFNIAINKFSSTKFFIRFFLLEGNELLNKTKPKKKGKKNVQKT